MGTRIIKNFTGATATIDDLGGITIAASSQKDLVNDYGKSIIDISRSDNLVELLAQGVSSYVVNDGNRDYELAEGLDLVRNIAQRFPEQGNKPTVRSDSRPIGEVIIFTSKGDTASGIGDGKDLRWDFANTDDDYGSPPANHKQKRLEFTFSEAIYIKEGTLYFSGALAGSYVSMSVVCSNGEYYHDRDGNPVQATEDTVVNRYISHIFFGPGDCPMGDEFNSEGCSENSIPATYKWWLDVVVPDSDSTSKGHIELEIYRPRSCLLPGESI